MKMRQIIGHEKLGRDSLDIDPGVWDHQEFTSFPKSTSNNPSVHGTKHFLRALLPYGGKEH